MADLEDYQWELGGVVFGDGCRVDHESDVAPPAYGVRSQDQAQPNSDGWTFGQDFFEPGLWQFKLFVSTEDEAGVHDALEELSLAWRADAYRKLPGEATALRYAMNGRTRVVYGRPRRFEPTFGAEYISGRIPITADFQTLSELFYDDTEESKEVGWLEPVSGGFTAPFTSPIQISEPGPSPEYEFTVGGPLPTPALVDFVGPISDGGILIDGAPFIQLQNDIPAGMTVTVDARPWVTAVYRKSDGAGIPGLLSARSRMPKMQLTPGTHTATLLGSTSTGTGKAFIRWRKAYPSV